jgi:quinol monooxygenase YgiN
VIIVSGHFRLPPGRIAEARAAMRTVIAASLAEAGCRAYSYAEDVTEPGLFRVYEEWDSRAALEAHFAAAHMREWQEARDALGFHDRSIAVREVGEARGLA